MEPRRLLLAALALLVLAVPAMCHAGALQHACECGAGWCAHDECAGDACSALVRPTGEDEHDPGLDERLELAALTPRAGSEAPGAIDAPRPPRRRTREPSADPPRGLTVHVSDVPLRI